MVSDFALNLDLPSTMIIMMFQLILLMIGIYNDEFIIVLMFAPLFTSVAVSLGYDLIWFGVLMILNIFISVQTPPYGLHCFISKR